MPVKTLLAIFLLAPNALALTPSRDPGYAELAALFERAQPASVSTPGLLMAGECKANLEISRMNNGDGIFTLLAANESPAGIRADVFTTKFDSVTETSGEFFTHHQLILRHPYGFNYGPYGSYGRPDPTFGAWSDYWWHPRLDSENSYQAALAREAGLLANHDYAPYLRALLKLKATRFPDQRSPETTTLAELGAEDQPKTYEETWLSLVESFEHPAVTPAGTQFGFFLNADANRVELTRKSFRRLDAETILMAQTRALLPADFRYRPLSALREIPDSAFAAAPEYYCIWYRSLAKKN